MNSGAGWEIRATLARFRHAQLLGSLTLLLVATPFVEGVVTGIFIDVFLLLTLLSAIIACATRRVHLVIGISLSVLMQAVAVYRTFNEISAVRLSYSVLGLCFFAYVTVLVMRDVFLNTKDVSANTICGALAGYLLMGVTWAFAYAAIDGIVPGSYSGTVSLENEFSVIQRFLGYSFVTLTTLGYGNVVPTNARAESIAVAEAIVGQIYLTVLVARLVALHLYNSHRDDSGGASE